MAHKGLKQLVSDESASLTYDQIGFDLMAVDHNLVGGKTYTIFKAEDGTDSSNIFYKNVPFNDTPHWIGIHNCGTVSSETCSVQAVSVDGDDFAKNATYNPSSLTNYIEVMPGDIIYGKFTEVSLVKTSSGFPVAYVDMLRLIRGV